MWFGRATGASDGGFDLLRDPWETDTSHCLGMSSVLIKNEFHKLYTIVFHVVPGARMICYRAKTFVFDFVWSGLYIVKCT